MAEEKKKIYRNYYLSRK